MKNRVVQGDGRATFWIGDTPLVVASPGVDLTPDEIPVPIANLGMASTRQLLEEVAVRLEIGGSLQIERSSAATLRGMLDVLPASALYYRTVDAMADMNCDKCGRSVDETGMLHRVSPKGERFVGRCNECRDGSPTDTNEKALLTALCGQADCEHAPDGGNHPEVGNA